MNRLEALIARDPGGRGVAALVLPGELGRGAALLTKAHGILVATGFAVGSDGLAETDGPPGALFLARALTALGKRVTLATHASCAAVLRAGLRALKLPAELAVLEPGADPTFLLDRHDLVVTVELPGQGADGEYRSMRGLVITNRHARLDELLPAAAARSLPTIAVGDGGNEAGMGKVLQRVRASVRLGELIGAVLPADVLVAAGTSNWGAYGLIAAIDPALLPTPAEELALLEALVAAGAVDGVTLRPEPTVDGIEAGLYFDVLLALRSGALPEVAAAGEEG